jgi:hypothetical protein
MLDGDNPEGVRHMDRRDRREARRVLHNSIRYPRVPHPSPGSLTLNVARTPQAYSAPIHPPTTPTFLFISSPGHFEPLLGLMYAMTSTSTSSTPSPQMAFLHTTPVSLVAIGSGDTGATEREARQQAIRKFLARAEISKVSLLLLLPGGYGTRRVSAMIRVSWHV